MPLKRTIDEQITEMAIFIWERCPALRGGLTKKQLKQIGALGQITIDRMAENYFAILENTERCRSNQKGYDLKNKTEVKSATTTKSSSSENAVRFQINGLKNKGPSHHIMAIIYNDVLSVTQILWIPNSFYRGKKQYQCGVDWKTGDLNGLQQYVGDYNSEGIWVYTNEE